MKRSSNSRRWSLARIWLRSNWVMGALLTNGRQGSWGPSPEWGMRKRNSKPTVSALVEGGRQQGSPATCRNRISWATPCQGGGCQLKRSQGMVFDPVAHSVCSKEAINRIKTLLDAQLEPWPHACAPRPSQAPSDGCLSEGMDPRFGKD